VRVDDGEPISGGRIDELWPVGGPDLGRPTDRPGRPG